MIEITELTKTYGRVKALNGISCTFKDSSITGLIGPNACGKTTLIKCLLGLALPTSGEIFFDGLPVRGMNHYREYIGYMPQTAEYPEHMTLRELSQLLCRIRRCGLPAVWNDLVEMFTLGTFLDRPMGSLSVGTKQKIAAVVAMMFQPRYLILDEPTAGLDPIASFVFKNMLRRCMQSKTSIIIVSHIISELEQLIDNVLFLLDGKVVFSGGVQQLVAQGEDCTFEDGIINLLQRNAVSEQSSRSNAE